MHRAMRENQRLSISRFADRLKLLLRSCDPAIAMFVFMVLFLCSIAFLPPRPKPESPSPKIIHLSREDRKLLVDTIVQEMKASEQARARNNERPNETKPSHP